MDKKKTIDFLQMKIKAYDKDAQRPDLTGNEINEKIVAALNRMMLDKALVKDLRRLKKLINN